MANESTGKNAVIDFASTVYDSLTQLNVDGQSQTISVEVSADGTGNAQTLKQAGAPSWTASMDIVVPTNAATIPNALDIGTSGTLEVFPAGDETGSLSYAFTAAEVASHSIASSATSFVVVSITFECTGEPTIAAA